MNRIRLAIVDDSAFMRRALARILEGEDAMDIVGTASSGEELLANIGAWNPDVITLDLMMPGMGGVLTLERIMKCKPVPVIILSTHSSRETQLTIEALHMGAVDFIDKQRYSLVDFDSLRRALVEKVFQLTGKKAERKEVSDALDPEEIPQIAAPARRTAAPPVAKGSFDAVFIVASTGGPPAIQRILEDIGPHLSVPVAIVQHMPEGFVRPFANRLNSHLPFTVKEACHGELFQSGTVFIGPTGYHLRVKQEGRSVHTALTRYPENMTHRPSGDVMLQSAASVYGEKAIAVLLTGMGRDGALGMAEMARAGSYTIAQDEASSVVYGMPKAATDLGAVCEVLDLKNIGGRIVGLLRDDRCKFGAR